MYLDDGRYYGPDAIRNAAFKLHRMYLQKQGIDISSKAEQVTQINNDEENLNQRQQRLEEIKQQRDVAEVFKQMEEEKENLARV